MDNRKIDYIKILSKRRRPEAHKLRWFPVLIVVILIFLSSALGLTLSILSKFAVLEVFLTLMPSESLLKETNILILGIDSARGHRSDTVMVAHINPTQRQATIISIPRDTIVTIPGRGLDKINHAFAFGGIELARKTAEEFLNINIPYYITIDVGGLANIIDKLGGITLDVEKRMYYVDFAQDLIVDLKPGVQRLSGREAVGYVRFRHDSEGDLGRILRQQKFLKAVANDLINKHNFWKSSTLIFELLSNIGTNLSVRQILGLTIETRQAYELNRIEMSSIPGKDLIIDGIYYWRPDRKAIKEIIDRLLERAKKEEGGNKVSG